MLPLVVFDTRALGSSSTRGAPPAAAATLLDVHNCHNCPSDLIFILYDVSNIFSYLGHIYNKIHYDPAFFLSDENEIVNFEDMNVKRSPRLGFNEEFLIYDNWG
jgi:hypothetical protein